MPKELFNPKRTATVAEAVWEAAQSHIGSLPMQQMGFLYVRFLRAAPAEARKDPPSSAPALSSIDHVSDINKAFRILCAVFRYYYHNPSQRVASMPRRPAGNLSAITNKYLTRLVGNPAAPQTRTAQAQVSDPAPVKLRQAGVSAPANTLPQETSSHAFYIKDSQGHWSVQSARNVYETIEAGVYEIGMDPYGGWFLEPKRVATDTIVPVPNPATAEAMRLATSFINGDFDKSLKRIGMINKLAMLLWGEPGTSKSVTIYRIAQYAIDRDWVVINVPKEVGLVRAALEGLRAVEPDRGIIAVWEEFDEVVAHRRTEGEMLQVLDGPHQVPKVMHIATTNYIDRIPARILARTRRISFQVEFDMPSAEERRAYFQAKVPSDHRLGSVVDIDEWVRRSEGMSIDNCSQIIVGVFAYKQTLDEVIADLHQRLKIAGKVKDDPEYDGDENHRPLRYRKHYDTNDSSLG